VASRAAQAGAGLAVIGILAGIAHEVADFTTPAAAAPGTGEPAAVAPAAGQQLAIGMGHSPAAFKGTRYRPQQAVMTHPASPSPSPSPSPSRPAKARTASPDVTTVSCSGSGGMLPEHYGAIVQFLLAHGYTHNAAAGIAGNIYQESKGNPESVGSGGGGLIGWTPLPSGFVTGSPDADLQTQLAAILTFNQQWSQYIPALNAASSPAAAADIYVTDFERAGIPAASNREAAANAVAAACKLLTAAARDQAL
jgi:hypothetical protein